MIEKTSLFHQKISKSKLKNLRFCGNFFNSRNNFYKIRKSILEGGVVAENFVRNNVKHENMGLEFSSLAFFMTKFPSPDPPSAKKVSYQPLKSIFGPIFDLHQLEIPRALTY